MKRKLIGILLAVVMIISLMPLQVACNTDEQVEKIKRELVNQNYDYSQTKAVPGPENGVADEIQYIVMDGMSNEALFMMVSLQGNVNREQASMYVIHDELVEGGQINASQYWFEKLDETYTDEEAFTKKEYTDPFKMVADNATKFNGAVLYDSRLVDAANSGKLNYNSRYADMAVLNLTVMMCGQYEAIALTYAQYNKLKNDYNLELDVLGDTTLFMKTNEYTGKLDADRSDRDIWMKVYRYALNKFGDSVADYALVHNPGFQAATFDYAIAHKLFVYNRIFTAEATEEETAIELAILNLTKANTPVLGVWYLQADEGSLVATVTLNYKYMIVSYESFNWSWTTGLPYEEMTNVQEEKITLDPTKNYVCFNFSEGDNNSYVHMQMPSMYDNTYRGQVAVGWTIAPTVWDTNPNIIRYYNKNWASCDGLTVPEAGVDYVSFTPPEESRGEFFALSDEYFGRINTGSMRTLKDDMIDPLPYAEYMENLTSVHCGYYETSFEALNNDNEDSFLFRDTLFIKQIQGSVAASYLSTVQTSGPFFYSVSLMGWSQTPATAKTIMDSIGDNFVAVTPNQLADLYKQYYESQFKDITHAEFESGMTRSEMGFLYKATDYTMIDEAEGLRYAEGKGYMTYKFSLASDVSKANFNLRVSGNYQIEVSNDNLYWYVMDKGYSSDVKTVEFNAGKYIKHGEPLYVRIGTRDLEETSTVYFYGCTLITDKTERDIVKIKGNDDVVHVEGGEITEYGRTGEFIYKINLKDGITSGDIAMTSEGALTVKISKDNKTYSDLQLANSGKLYSAPVNDLNGVLYIKFNCEDALETFKFTPAQEAVKQVSVSPVESKVTDKLLLSLDSSNEIYGISSSRTITGKDAMLFRFDVADGVNKGKLRLNILGMYKIEISNDGKTFTTINQVNDGENPAENIELDITQYATAGKTVYLRISLSSNLSGKIVRLSKLRFISDKTEEWLLNKIDKERTADAEIYVKSVQTGVDFSTSEANSLEYKLIDSYTNDTLYLINQAVAHRLIGVGQEVVYKFALSGDGSDEFYNILNVDKPDTVTKFRLKIYVMNGFKLSVSTDKENWRVAADADDESAASGGNAAYYEVEYTAEEVAAGTVYLKLTVSDKFVSGKTHDPLLRSIAFFFN